MTPILALVVLGRTDTLTEAAMKEGSRILATFDVPGPFVLGRSYENVQSGPTEIVLGVSAGNGAKYHLNVWKASGRCWLAERDDSDVGGAPRPRPHNAVAIEKQTRKAVRAIARLRVPFRRLRPTFTSWGKTDRIVMPVAIDGHPFLVGYYNYEIRLDPLDGSFQAYAQVELPPEVDHVKPRLSSEDALAATKRLLASDPVPPRAPGGRSWREFVTDPTSSEFSPPIDHYERRLVWVVPEGRTRARLAWSVPFSKLLHEEGPAAGATRGGRGELMLDAATGESLQPRYERVSYKDLVEPRTAGIFVQGAGPPGRDQGASLTCLTCSAKS